jgi:hypothetical protein
MKKNENNNLNTRNGITLIALVVTIVLNAIAWSKDGKIMLKYNKTLANTANPF